MPETPPIESLNTPPPRSSVPLLLSAFAIALVLLGFYCFTRNSEQKHVAVPSAAHLPFGSVERAYAPNIQIENVTLSRAENFIHQEVTTLSAETINAGGCSLAGLEVTIEFFDGADQIALRETHSVIEVGAPALTLGERRTLEVSFEHIPASWNRQQPTVRVTGMRLIP
jgi:hypothetical protein